MTDWQKIKTNSPKAFNKFVEKHNLQDYIFNNGLHLLAYCYCAFEKFFDKQEIIIEICYYDEDNQYGYFIYKSQMLIKWEEDGFYYKTRQEAQDEAIVEAFKILNEKLEANK